MDDATNDDNSVITISGNTMEQVTENGVDKTRCLFKLAAIVPWRHRSRKGKEAQGYG